jgi:WD40 repeat protein
VATGNLIHEIAPLDSKARQDSYQVRSIDPQAVQFSDDGTHLLTANGNYILNSYGSVTVWNAKTGALDLEFGAQMSSINDLALASDGLRVATAGGDHTARLWDASTGTLYQTFAHPDRLSSVEFDRSSTKLVTGCHDGIVRIWDVHPETRSVSAIAKSIDENSPWTLRRGAIVARP